MVKLRKTVEDLWLSAKDNARVVDMIAPSILGKAIGRHEHRCIFLSSCRQIDDRRACLFLLEAWLFSVSLIKVTQ